MTMSKKAKPFLNRRITADNLAAYLRNAYPGCTDIRCILSGEVQTEPLLQKDFDDRQNCSLTSVTAITYTRLHRMYGEKYALQGVYDTVKGGTCFLSYHPNGRGTNPFFIPLIWRHAMKAYRLRGRIRSRYLKNIPLIGYNYAAIRRSIDRQEPVILNMAGDGRRFYKNHTVTCIGYEAYAFSLPGRQHGEARFLKVLDNWSRQISYIDFSRLSPVSSVNFIK